MRETHITVAGLPLQVRSDADEQYVRDLADEINARMRSIKRTSARDHEFKALAMVSLALLDELRTAKVHSETVQERAKQFAKRVIAHIDELLTHSLSQG